MYVMFSAPMVVLVNPQHPCERQQLWHCCQQAVPPRLPCPFDGVGWDVLSIKGRFAGRHRLKRQESVKRRTKLGRIEENFLGRRNLLTKERHGMPHFFSFSDLLSCMPSRNIGASAATKDRGTNSVSLPGPPRAIALEGR